MFSFPTAPPAEAHDLPRLIAEYVPRETPNLAIRGLCLAQADGKRLYSSEKYSDMVIKCQGRQWKVHRAVVCPQSKPLAAAVDGNFKVGSPSTCDTLYLLEQEAIMGEIDLEEDEPEIVELMLQFLYKGAYSDGRTSSVASGSSTPPSQTTKQAARQQPTSPRSPFDFSATRAPVFGGSLMPATSNAQPNASTSASNPLFNPFGNRPPTSSVFGSGAHTRAVRASANVGATNQLSFSSSKLFQFCVISNC
jgi:hypothetical protein